MTRVSLKEAYDNKDVAVQIFSLKDDVARIDEVIENLPNPDLTNCVIKDTEQTITGEKTFTKKIHAEGGIEVNTEGGFEINGPLTVDGDIIQNGQAYETHAEQVFSQNDLIVTRDGAVSALPAGVVSGIQIKKYDGVNDARLAVDNAGVARVGDVGDEQPLMTRAEVADMVGGAFLKWDAVHSKAISGTLDDVPTVGSSNGVKSSGVKNAIDSVNNSLSSAITGKVSGTGTIGDDKHPVKVVNGTAVQISDPVLFDTGNGDTTQFVGSLMAGVYGEISLTKISKNRGILNVSITIDSALGGSIADTDTIPASAYIGALGISAITGVTSGIWSIFDNYSPYTCKINITGYASRAVCRNGNISFGRVHNTSGNWGNWNFQNMTGFVQTSFVVNFT